MSAAFLSERWRAASHASTWRTPGDWHCPAVEKMVRAALDGVDTESAAAALGTERGQQGVGLTEGLDDLAVLFGILSNEEPPYAVTKSFAREWSNVTIGGILNRASTDDLTGMPTLDYLVVRLHELYAEASVTNVEVNDEHCIVITEANDDHFPRWQRIMRKSLVARVLRSVFSRGQPIAVLPSGNFVVIARRDDCLDEWIARVRVELAHGAREGNADGAAITVRVDDLPAGEFDAVELISEL
ncbi:MAG: hypothetical protein ACOH19_05090 [Rhodoglobus sp.]